MKSASFVVIAALMLSGCTAKKPVKFNVIPTNCVNVRITDFTKICKPMSPTSAVCDGVIVRYYCTSVKKD